MEIFLVQHGQAMTKVEDPLRPLTLEGADSVERMARWAHDACIPVTQIRHSGKLRAEQTAQIFADYLKPSGSFISIPGLGPNDDVVSVARTVIDEAANTMFVGHLPFLGRLAAYFVTGNAENQLVKFRNAGIVCLVQEHGRWFINWVTTPDLLI